MTEQEGEETLDLDIDSLFKDPEDSQPPDKESTDNADKNEGGLKDSDLTKNMSKRINQVREETEKSVLERVAKENGFESYTAMRKASEDKIVKDHGFDPKDVSEVLGKMLEQRLADDPRIKRLNDYEAREKEAYIKEQVAEINKVTGQKLTPDQLPKEAIDLWGKGVDLSQAYFATQGKSLITKGINNAQNGTMNHLAPHSSNNTPKTRGLNDEEKDMYRFINPDITEKELSEKTVEI